MCGRYDLVMQSGSWLIKLQSMLQLWCITARMKPGQVTGPSKNTQHSLVTSNQLNVHVSGLWQGTNTGTGERATLNPLAMRHLFLALKCRD